MTLHVDTRRFLLMMDLWMYVWWVYGASFPHLVPTCFQHSSTVDHLNSPWTRWFLEPIDSFWLPLGWREINIMTIERTWGLGIISFAEVSVVSSMSFRINESGGGLTFNTFLRVQILARSYPTATASRHQQVLPCRREAALSCFAQGSVEPLSHSVPSASTFLLPRISPKSYVSSRRSKLCRSRSVA